MRLVFRGSGPNYPDLLLNSICRGYCPPLERTNNWVPRVRVQYVYISIEAAQLRVRNTSTSKPRQSREIYKYCTDERIMYVYSRHRLLSSGAFRYCVLARWAGYTVSHGGYSPETIGCCGRSLYTH